MKKLKNILNLFCSIINLIITILLLIYMIPTIPFQILRRIISGEYDILKENIFFKIKGIKMTLEALENEEPIKFTKSAYLQNLDTYEKIEYKEEKILGQS